MSKEDYMENHFYDDIQRTKECEQCDQDDILTTVNYTVLDNEHGKDETFEQDLCNDCIYALKKNNNIIINQIR